MAVEALCHSEDDLSALNGMGHDKCEPVRISSYERKDERLDEGRNPELPGLAADEAGRELPFPGFQQFVEDDLLGTVHDQRDDLSLFVYDFEPLDELFDTARAVRGKVREPVDPLGQPLDAGVREAPGRVILMW